MMDTFKLSTTEAWALATALMLPIESGSSLAGWLSGFKAPEVLPDIPDILTRLEARGYLTVSRVGEAQPGFLEGLTALSLNPATLTVALRRNGRLTFTHFALLKNEAVQFMPEGEKLTFHAPARIFDLPDWIVPDWFQVSHSREFELNLPVEAFALLVAACQLQALQEVLAETPGEASFSRIALLQAGEDAAAWLDIYQSLGILDATGAPKARLPEHLQLLLDLGILRASEDSALVIGERARPFYDTWNDPDLCAVSFSLQTMAGRFPLTGSLLFGNGRLLQAELTASSVMRLRQLSRRQLALDWVEQWIERASQIEPLLTPPPDSLLESVGEGSAVSAANEPWKLVVTEGPGTGLEFPIQTALTVGRNPENEVKLQSPKVSRQHARFELRQGSVWIQDLNSSNGTFVNGVRIDRPVMLKNGDLILIGDSSLRLVGPSSESFEGATLIGRPASLSSQPSPAVSLRCPRCGNPYTAGAKFCNHCGTRLT